MKKENLIALFSGGRTSGRMCKILKDNYTHKYNIKFVYTNTGQEHDKTLDFINLCDIEMKLNLIWLEAKVNKKGVGTSYTIVNYETAKRYSDSNNPFENMVKKFGLPNKDFPHCTRELKIEPFKKWAKDEFGKDYKIALGIRADEPKRLKQSKTDNEKIFPLAYDFPMTKGDVLIWWRNQHFDLQVEEHLGNCLWCWKKSDTKLWTIAKDYPSLFDFPAMLEKKYSETSNYDRKDKRKMFRKYRTTKDIILESKLSFKEFKESNKIQESMNFNDDECPEECGSFIPN